MGRMSAMDMTPVEFSHLRLGQNLMILPIILATYLDNVTFRWSFERPPID
jgi:hypothetical protein